MVLRTSSLNTIGSSQGAFRALGPALEVLLEAACHESLGGGFLEVFGYQKPSFGIQNSGKYRNEWDEF